MDWIERGIFIALALMLIYTVFVLIRFLHRLYLVRREYRALVNDSWDTFERGRRRLIAELSSGLRTLKAITSAAPFLGLAGTSYGILAALSFGVVMERNAFLLMISARIVATLISAAAGILVAIPAILVHNFLRTRIDRFRREFSRSVPVGMASYKEPTAQPFRFAQRLPLKKRFSRLPPFALIAAPALASVVVLLMTFEPYETPRGLEVRLLPIGALDGDCLSSKQVVITIVAGANGSPLIRVNSKETPPHNLEEATRRELKLLAEPRVYVEAESTVAWADVTNVIGRFDPDQVHQIFSRHNSEKNFTACLNRLPSPLVIEPMRLLVEDVAHLRYAAFRSLGILTLQSGRQKQTAYERQFRQPKPAERY